MDTVHDLGGVQGFGPIPGVDEADTPLFQAEWKARVWATAMLSYGNLKSDQTGWTLEWSRHVLERLPPHLYLSLNYFEKWTFAVMATAIDEGIATPAEFASSASHADRFSYSNATAPVQDTAEPPARFKVGDQVRALRNVGSMHTRLTGYIRGRIGVIDSVIGPQPMPDKAAQGVLLQEPTYVVKFRMSDLWPEAKDSQDSLLIDLWDSYLEPT